MAESADSLTVRCKSSANEMCHGFCCGCAVDSPSAGGAGAEDGVASAIFPNLMLYAQINFSFFNFLYKNNNFLLIKILTAISYATWQKDWKNQNS